MGAIEDSGSCHNGITGTETPGDAEEALEPPIPQPNFQRDHQMTIARNDSLFKTKCNILQPSPGTSSSWSNQTLIEAYAADLAHTFPVPAVLAALNTNLGFGLTADEAAVRLDRDGPNKVSEAKAASVGEIFTRQISNSLTLVLVITMGISFGIDDYIEGSVIAAVIVLNIVIGFVQDYRAEQQILSLQALSAPMSKVLRDGQLQTVKAEKLVNGDIVKLSVGDVAPADIRLADGINVAMDEALLTGESLPVAKMPLETLVDRQLGIGDRVNMCYAATTMTMGRCTGVVISTGMQTEVGKIANLLRQKRGDSGSSNMFVRGFQSTKRGIKSVLGLTGTPLQVKLSKFALLLFALAILLAIIVFSVNVWDIDGEVLIYGICVAVAVIPESLIAVLTITVAVGTKSMAKGNVIVRRLAALEAVGGVNAICSDKTGTLTQGKMVVRKAWIPGEATFVTKNTSNPFDPTSGHVEAVESRDGYSLAVPSDSTAGAFFRAIALCNLSTVYNQSLKSSADTTSICYKDEWTAVGEPTEIALQVFAMRFGYGKPKLLGDSDKELVAEFPFDSSIKRMTVFYKNRRTGSVEAYTKGAAEAVIPLLLLSDAEKQSLLFKADQLAAEGLRVLCIAHKHVKAADQNQWSDRKSAEVELSLCGLVGLYDPPRLETLLAVQKCQRAGITVHMLTGDHAGTAEAIAHEVGILHADCSVRMVMKADEFDNLSDDEIDRLSTLPLVLARCSPSTKVRMVDALHRRGAFCAMTGDGVNDAPSLKRANVGIAMGLNGTDVAKDASDMVLTDDNFASIVTAVEEGRRLFDNIQKFLMHLLISNIAQVVLLLVGLAFIDENGYSVFPLSPLEILWVNLITSSFLAIGLGLEPASPDIMLRPPHDLRVGVFTRELIVDKFIYGLFMGSLCLVAFVSVAYGVGGGDLGVDCNASWNSSCDVTFRSRATAWSTLTNLLLVTAWEVKSFSRSLFALDPSLSSKGLRSLTGPIWRNRFLFWAVVAGFAIAFPIVYLPVINEVVFKHTSITWEWGVVFACLVTYVALVECWKALKRRFGIGTAPAGYDIEYATTSPK